MQLLAAPLLPPIDILLVPAGRTATPLGTLPLLALLTIRRPLAPLRHLRRPTQARQDNLVVSRHCVHGAQLRHTEPLGKQGPAQRDEGDDEHGKANGGNGLRDCDAGSDAEDLPANVEEDLAPADAEEGLGARDEAALGEEVDELVGYAVAFYGTPLHG